MLIDLNCCVYIVFMNVIMIFAQPVRRPVSNTNTSDLIFPDTEEYDLQIIRYQRGMPKCKNTFCEDIEHYPENYFEKILKKSHYRMEFFDRNPIEDDDLKIRLWENDENFICTSLKRTVFPKMAQNIKNEWKFIYNFKQYKQGVRIEVCRKETACNLFGNTPFGIVTKCKQKYMERRLLSADSTGAPVIDNFKLPSSCACSYKRDIGFLRFRRHVSKADG